MLTLFNRLREWLDTRQHGPVAMHTFGGPDGWRRQHADGYEARSGPPPRRKPDRVWQAKQKLAAPARYYGGGGTVHDTADLDIETFRGQVVAVWFRCQPLPFKVSEASPLRFREMLALYRQPMPKLTGVEVLDPSRTAS